GLGFIVGLQKLDLDVESTDILAAPPHISLSCKLSFLAYRHDSSAHNQGWIGRQPDPRGLADIERAQIGFADIHSRPDGGEIVDGQNRGSRSNPFPDFQSFVDHNAVNWRENLRVL